VMKQCRIGKRFIIIMKMPTMKRMMNNITKVTLSFSKKFGCKSHALIFALPHKKGSLAQLV
jgi:hypothetical protein